MTHAPASWVSLGGPAGGTVSALALANSDTGATVVFAGTKAGLLRAHLRAHLRGRNAGEDAPLAWERLASAPLGVMALAVSPDFATDQTVIAGAADGIHVSRDAGNTWHVARMPALRSMVLALGIALDEHGEGLLLAGTLEDGIWCSTDRGESWRTCSFGLLDATVFSVALSPAFARDQTMYAGTDTAIYLSYNGGRAWKQLDFPEEAAPVLSLALSPGFASNGTLYAGTEQSGLYRSTDHGTTWAPLSLPARCVSALLVTPSNALLAATEQGVLHSADNGETWSCALEVADAISLAAAGDTTMAGLIDQGAWIAAGRHDWRPAPIPPSRSILGMALSPAFDRDGLAFIYGLQEGVWRTTDGGSAWSSLNDALPSLDIHALALSPAHGGRVVVAASPEGVFVSADAGDHWQRVAQEPAGSIALSPNGRRLAVALAENEVRASDDLGRSWHSVAGPWDAGGRIVALAVSDDAVFREAILHGADNTVSIWQGRAGQQVRLLSRSAGPNPVVCFWIPPASDFWYAGLSNTVWKITGQTAVANSLPLAEGARDNIVALTGAVDGSGCAMFACAGRRLWHTRNGSDWCVIGEPAPDPIIGIGLSPAFAVDRSAYALLLGGQFCRVAL